MALDRKKKAALLTGLAVAGGVVLAVGACYLFYVFASVMADGAIGAAMKITNDKETMAWFNASVSTLKTWHLIAMLAITALIARS